MLCLSPGAHPTKWQGLGCQSIKQSTGIEGTFDLSEHPKEKAEVPQLHQPYTPGVSLNLLLRRKLETKNGTSLIQQVQCHPPKAFTWTFKAIWAVSWKPGQGLVRLRLPPYPGTLSSDELIVLGLDARSAPDVEVLGLKVRIIQLFRSLREGAVQAESNNRFYGSQCPQEGCF